MQIYPMSFTCLYRWVANEEFHKRQHNRVMNIEEIQKQFWEEGYVVVKDFFDHSLMDELHNLIIKRFLGEAVDSCLNDEFTQKSKCEIIPWFPQREDVKEFDRIDQILAFEEITTAILGENWGNLYSMVMFSPKGSKGQAWHQDCPPEDHSRFNLNRLIYTRDIVSEIGGQVQVVPGTHREGPLPAGEVNVDFENQITLYPKKGTLVLLHGHTYHRVLPVTGFYRVSTNYRAAPEGIPAEITDICVYRNMRYQFSTNSVVEDRTLEVAKG